MALASATFAVRNPSLLIALLEGRSDRKAALTLVAEGFDMLEEDYLEEQFFAAVRKAYGAVAEGSVTRATIEGVIGGLEF